MAKELTGYYLSRSWFDFCFENPDKIKPNHTALYFFTIEHCNRLGWKQKFGLPTTMAMEAIGLKSYNTYKKTLLDLIDFGFIKMIEVSRNQYSSNIVALLNFNKANNKALDKALLKHTSKQSESTVQSIDSIYKPITYNQEPITREQEKIPSLNYNNNFPTEKEIDKIKLPGIKIEKIIERCKIEFQFEIDTGRVTELFEVFKSENFTGKKFYQDYDDIFKHFSNSLKFYKIPKNGSHFKSSSQNNGLGGKSGGFGILSEALGQSSD